MELYFCLLAVFAAVLLVDAGTQSNCRNATYHVKELYQACPHPGPILPTSGGAGGARSPRLDVLEMKYNLLQSGFKEMNARMATCCGGQGTNIPNIPNTPVYDVKKTDGKYPRDCTEIYQMGYRCTGVYFIQPQSSSAPFQAFCEMAYDGWTVIMRRFDGTVDFYRTWNEYKNGFGSPSAEHWLGNDHIHLLTKQKNYKLRIEFTYWANDLSYYADYSRFRIGSEAEKYKLVLTGLYSGNSGHDGISGFNNVPFSTKDQDNDVYSASCAQIYKGAFWYTKCHSDSHPTGIYKADCSGHDCMEWKSRESLKAVIMKVKSD